MSDNRIIPLTPANEKNSTTPTTAAQGAVLPQPVVLVLTILVAVAGVLPMRRRVPRHRQTHLLLLRFQQLPPRRTSLPLLPR